MQIICCLAESEDGSPELSGSFIFPESNWEDQALHSLGGIPLSRSTLCLHLAPNCRAGTQTLLLIERPHKTAILVGQVFSLLARIRTTLWRPYTSTTIPLSAQALRYYPPCTTSGDPREKASPEAPVLGQLLFYPI